MLFRLFKFIFIPNLNRTFSRILRPVGRFIPERFQFPVLGFFGVKIETENILYIEGHYTSYISRVLFWKGIQGFEYNSLLIFKDIIRSATTFLDIGANFGLYSLIAAKLNSSMEIVAFEPFDDAADAFHRNIEYNRFKNIQVERIALSDKEGESVLYYSISKEFPGYKFQLAGDNSLADLSHANQKSVKIKTNSLDAYVFTKGFSSIDLVKIDTETTEYIILSNGVDTIKKYRPVILSEVLQGYSEAKLEKMLKALDYKFYLVVDGGVRERDSLQYNKVPKNDYFLVPVEKTEQMAKFVIND